MQYYLKKWCIVIFQFIKNNNGKYYIGNLISVQNVHCVVYYPFLLKIKFWSKGVYNCPEK